jgi:UDP-N-acetylglucosamine--N-acetylmuramyl-(pentapeptide) pyrophosphoryl-undecaprenol N-acetylglucosamine transferase
VLAVQAKNKKNQKRKKRRKKPKIKLNPVENTKRHKKIIISGGGTGGHIFPAISIANALKALQPDMEILFVGALGRMEMEKVPAAGYQIIGLPISGFQRKLTPSNLKVIFKLMYSLIKARTIIKNFKPDVAVGVGGYASGPLLKIASQRGIPTVIQEQNSYAGVTNKLLAKKAAKICVAYEGMERFFPKQKIILTGNPVRQDLINLETKREEAMTFFGLDKSKKTILILGGSLGARTINDSLAAHLEVLKKADIQVIWQTGSRYYEEMKQKTDISEATNIKTMAFISRMDLAYAAADMVVSRAGAGTISELCLVGKASVLVPSPNVAEDHQTMNARSLTSRNAAIMIKDADARENLVIMMIEIIKNPEELQRLSQNILKLAEKDSAKRIAEEILKLIND